VTLSDATEAMVKREIDHCLGCFREDVQTSVLALRGYTGFWNSDFCTNVLGDGLTSSSLTTLRSTTGETPRLKRATIALRSFPGRSIRFSV